MKPPGGGASGSFIRGCASPTFVGLTASPCSRCSRTPRANLLQQSILTLDKQPFIFLNTYTIGIGKERGSMETKKQKTIINFKKAHSLLAKILKMVEENQYCIDIMQQNLAVIGLLKSAHRMLMENHLNTCFRKAMESRDERRKKAMIKEILKVTNFFNR